MHDEKEGWASTLLDYFTLGIAALGILMVAYVVIKFPYKNEAPPPDFNNKDKFEQQLENTPLEELLAMKYRDDKSKRMFTLDELAKYHATAETRYIGAKGLIFDVTSNEVYKGPEGGYSMFCGKDASVALAKMNHDEDSFNVKKHDWRKLTKEQIVTLNQWIDFYHERYPIVGYLYDPMIDTESKKDL